MDFVYWEWLMMMMMMTVMVKFCRNTRQKKSELRVKGGVNLIVRNIRTYQA